jgi:hypothetical protein
MKPAYTTLHRALAAAFVLAAAACAQDRPDIDTVQPNYIKKSDLLGREWYFRMTTVDASFTASNSFEGAMSHLERGVFEVQEKMLLFYRTYEFMHGSEKNTLKSDVDTAMKDENGKPIRHAVLEDYAQIRCTPGTKDADAPCGPAAWCADASKPKLADEEDYHGNCVREATRYIYRGSPLNAWPIQSHFDINYEYSSASGEKTNKKVENTSDRHWYDRDYMRVGWASGSILTIDNLVDTLGEGTGVWEGEVAPTDEKFEMGTTKSAAYGTQRFISYIERRVLTAQTTYLQGYGEIPICFFYPWYIGGVYDCTSEEYKARSFFLEVPKYGKGDERKYVAREQDDVEFEKFGFFRTERPVYDLSYANAFSNNIRRAQRHRIWDKYVKCWVEPGETRTDGMANDNPCKAKAAGLVWKGGFDYTKMKPTPIVYYINQDHPRDLVQQSIEIAKSWSDPFSQVAEYRTGQKPAHDMFVLCENNNLDAIKAKSEGKPTAEFSDTTIGGKKYAGTPAGNLFCKDMDKPHQFGDLRYSFMHAVPSPNQAGLYGYGPSAADPLTGEVIAASAHSYPGVMKQGAEAALQAIELHAGVKDFNDIKRASEKLYNVAATVKAHYDGKGPKSTAELQDWVKGLVEPDVRERITTVGFAKRDDAGTWAQKQMATIQSNPALDAMLVSGDESWFAHALFKDPRINPNKAAAVSPADLKQLSIAHWGHVAAMRAREKVFAELGKKTIHLADFADGALVGLAEEYGRQFDAALCKAYAETKATTIFANFSDNKRLMKDAQDKTIECTGAMEFESQGQAAGRLCLDSTFVEGGATKTGKRWHSCASKDLMQDLRRTVNSAAYGNPTTEKYKDLPSPLYRDTTDEVVRATQKVGIDVVERLRAEIKLELWQRIYKGTQMHEVGHTLGLRHNFEASTDSLNFHREFWNLKLDAKNKLDVVNLWQADTIEQGRNHLRTQQLASVMDYTAKFNGRDAGVGLYDKAALKFSYGDMVEVFNHPPAVDKAPAVQPADGGALPALTDYLTLPAQDAPAQTTMLLNQGSLDLLKLTRRVHWSSWPRYFATDATKGDAIDNIYDRKHVPWSTFRGDRCSADSQCAGGRVCRAFGEASFCTATKDAGGKTLVEVPYRFCSDEVNGQTPTCSTWDEGVDAYEIARNALDDYENYWFFYGYSRDSETFHPNTYNGRVFRYLYQAHRQFQYWAVNFATYNKNGWWKKKFGVDWDLDPNGGLSGTYAAMLTFNKLANVVTRPSTGIYAWNQKRSRYEPYNQLDQNTGDPHLLDETQGARPLYGSYGGGYMYRPMSGGQIYDRMNAMKLLADPTFARFIATNESEDTRRYLVSFFGLFPRQVMNLFGGLSVEDANYYGWYLQHGGTEKPDDDVLAPRKWVGPGSENTFKQCADFKAGTPAVEMKGCIKYTIFPDARPFFPSSRFRMPLLGSLYGMAMLRENWDRSYLDISRVFLKGNQAEIKMPEGTEKVEFTDPLSGKTYVAQRTANDVLNPGYLAVQAAQKELDKFPSLKALQDAYLFSEYQFRVSLLDLMRTMHETYE